MSKTAVVYWSGTGNTEAMAEALAKGVRAAGGAAEVFSVDAIDPAKVGSYDSVALGCPAMGAEELEDSEFAPFYEAVKGTLAGKKVVLFGSYGWGGGDWMNTWAEDAQAAGISFAADPVIANEAPDDEAIEALKAAGAALA